MNNLVLTPQQSIVARNYLGISQTFAAKKANVDRSQLSLFENSRLVPRDVFLKKLRSFYESRGAEFVIDEKKLAPGEPVKAEPVKAEPVKAEPETKDLSDADVLVSSDSSKKGFFIRDGYVVTGAMPEQDADSLLDEIHANNEQVAEMLAMPIEINDGILGDDEPTDECELVTKDVLLLLSRNYNLVQELKGEDSIDLCDDEEHMAMRKAGEETQTDLIGNLFAGGLPFLDDDDDEGDGQ